MLLNLKYFRSVALFGIFALVSANSMAADTNKIAVVDSMLAIFGSAAAQAELKAAEESANFISLKAKYESSIADMKAMKEEAETQGMTWSQDQIDDHKKKMGYANADVELTVQKIKAEQQQLQQRILKDLRPLASQAIEQILEEESITILLQAEATLYADPQTDITAKVASRIDENLLKAAKEQAETEQ